MLEKKLFFRTFFKLRLAKQLRYDPPRKLNIPPARRRGLGVGAVPGQLLGWASATAGPAHWECRRRRRRHGHGGGRGAGWGLTVMVTVTVAACQWASAQANVASISVWHAGAGPGSRRAGRSESEVQRFTVRRGRSLAGCRGTHQAQGRPGTDRVPTRSRLPVNGLPPQSQVQS
jgi:hypothetical protein